MEEKESSFDDEYEYYTDTENEADGEDEEEDDKDTVKDIPVRKDSAWRKKFELELESDSGRDSAKEIEREPIIKPKDNNRTQLHHAVLCDDVFKLNKLLDEGLDPNQQDSDGLTPLHLACQDERQTLVMILLARGADGSIIDTCRRSPLHYAVQNGFTRIVQSLLDYETYMEGKDRFGQTVLHIAALRELSQTMNLLICRAKKQGTDEDVLRFIDTQNRDKQTALHLAAERSFCDCVKILLRYKCQVNITDQEGKTGLHLCCGSSQDVATEIQTTIVVSNLISHGGKVSIKDEDGLTPLLHTAISGRIDSAKILLEEGADISSKDSKGLTALHHAARNHQSNYIKMLVKAGLSVDVKDKKQLTALHHAILCNSLDAVKTLCLCGADIYMEDTEGRKYTEYANMYDSQAILLWLAKKYPTLYINEESKETIIHYLASQGLPDVIRILLQTGHYKVDVRDEDDKTPLHYAAINCREDVFEFLVNFGADIDARDGVGATPLHFAVRWGSEAIVKYILRKKGSDAVHILDSGDRLGRTPLHYAASQKTGLSYITNLLKAGANKDYRDHSGMTPLHLACRFGNISLVRLLLDEGADKSVKDGQGMSPADHAKEKDCLTILGMIEKSGKRKECSNRINC